jgi:hypothetical protein
LFRKILPRARDLIIICLEINQPLGGLFLHEQCGHVF